MCDCDCGADRKKLIQTKMAATLYEIVLFVTKLNQLASLHVDA